MPSIRRFIIEATMLIGTVAGIAAGIGSYLANVPDSPEHAAIAAAWADPETTGSITPGAEAPAATAEASTSDRRPSASGETAPTAAWSDPPRHRKPR